MKKCTECGLEIREGEAVTTREDGTSYHAGVFPNRCVQRLREALNELATREAQRDLADGSAKQLNT